MVTMKDKIKQWLIEEELFKEEIQDNSTNFRLIIMFPKDHFMEIIQPLKKADMIIVASPTVISPEHIDAMTRSNSQNRAEFIWALKFFLNNFLIDFELTHPENILEKFAITDVIFDDRLSKDRLMATIRKVWKANLQAVWIIQKEFGVVKPQRDELGTESVMYM